MLGKRVLVTRAAHQAGKLSEGLRALGAEPVAVPVLEIRPLDDYESLDAALKEIDSFDLVIFTSVNGVTFFKTRSEILGMDLSKVALPEAAVVGKQTAEAAHKLGFRIGVVPEESRQNSEGLAAALGESVSGKDVLFVRAKVARDVVPNMLCAAGAKLTVVDAYQTMIPESAIEQLPHALAGGIDAVAFTSGSSADHLAKVAELAGVSFPFAGVPAISIGPVTSETLRRLGWEPAVEAAVSDVPGLIEAVRQGIGNLTRL